MKLEISTLKLEISTFKLELSTLKLEISTFKVEVSIISMWGSAYARTWPEVYANHTYRITVHKSTGFTQLEDGGEVFVGRPAGLIHQPRAGI